MKRSLSPRKSQRSFTLVEVLVSLAILSFIMILLARMLGMTSVAYNEGHSRVDDFTKSRAMLDLVAGDIERGVFRPDLPAFGTGSQFMTNNGVLTLTNGAATNAFFTRRAGVGSGMRDLSLVLYTLVLTNTVLERCDHPVPWPSPGNWSSDVSFGTSLDAILPLAVPRQMAQGVVDFELAFQRADGSLTNFYTGYISTNPVVAVGIGLAVVDGQTLKLLTQNKIQAINGTLTNAFLQSMQNTNGIKAGWDAALTNGFFDNYPKALNGGLKTFERWVPCQPPF